MTARESSSTLFVTLCCIIAAVRVLVFAAVFPLFNNVDERAHVDLVLKYAHGNVPKGVEPYSAESASYFALYSTPEYFLDPQQEAYGPATWNLPADEREAVIEQTTQAFQARPNHESGEPPLYYALAGLWLNLGRVFHLSGAWLLYWVRFLNVPICAVTTWLGFVAVRSFDENRYLQYAVPLFIALWPQTTSYAITSDSLSPLYFGICFVGIVKLLNAKRPSFWLATCVGLGLAAACLTKTANLPLIFIVSVAVLLRISASPLAVKENLLIFAAFLISAAVPLGTWFGWNHYYFGDLTATHSKIELLGWTTKPIGAWLSHPVFTLRGAGEFWPELMATFWRGEFTWHGHPLAWSVADSFYWISSAAALVITITVLCAQKLQKNERQVLLLATGSFLILISFMLFLSIRFDFQGSRYPSREHPYLVAGRLLGAAAVPFFLIYGFALERLASLFKARWIRVALLGATAVFVITAQLVANWPAFSSRYNFFHIPTF